MNDYRGRLKNDLQDEEYRYAYDEEFANSRMATQIKVIREQRDGMTQKELAEAASMKQSRISALENVDYSAWSISTLRRIARALGVRLSFKFESWGELIPELESFDRKSLERPDFENDLALNPVPIAREIPDGLRDYLTLSMDDPQRGEGAKLWNYSRLEQPGSLHT